MRAPIIDPTCELLNTATQVTPSPSQEDACDDIVSQIGGDTLLNRQAVNRADDSTETCSPTLDASL